MSQWPFGILLQNPRLKPPKVENDEAVKDVQKRAQMTFWPTSNSSDNAPSRTKLNKTSGTARHPPVLRTEHIVLVNPA